MALIDDFKTRFPEFDAAVVDQYFPIIEPLYSCYYGGSLDDPCDKEAILNLLAHLLVINSRQKSGSVQLAASKSVGSVSVSNVQSTISRQGAEFWLTTKYGQQFLMLTQNNIGAHFV